MSAEARMVPVPQPARLLDDGEMRGAFAALANDNELWLAVNQRLRDLIVEAAMEVSDRETAREHGPLAHAAGGVEWLGRLQADLNQRFAETHAGDLVV